MALLHELLHLGLRLAVEIRAGLHHGVAGQAERGVAALPEVEAQAVIRAGDIGGVGGDGQAIQECAHRVLHAIGLAQGEGQRMASRKGGRGKADELLAQTNRIFEVALLAIYAAQHRTRVEHGIGNLTEARLRAIVMLAHDNARDHVHAIQRPGRALLEHLGDIVGGDQVGQLGGDGRLLLGRRGLADAVGDLAITIAQRIVARIEDIEIAHEVRTQGLDQGGRQRARVLGHLDRAIGQGRLDRLDGQQRAQLARLHVQRTRREGLDKLPRRKRGVENSAGLQGGHELHGEQLAAELERDDRGPVDVALAHRHDSTTPTPAPKATAASAMARRSEYAARASLRSASPWKGNAPATGTVA